ncbi:MAG: carbohydrate kinase family protein [Candidatus Woesearchaeota archaeon]
MPSLTLKSSLRQKTARKSASSKQPQEKKKISSIPAARAAKPASAKKKHAGIDISSTRKTSAPKNLKPSVLPSSGSSGAAFSNASPAVTRALHRSSVPGLPLQKSVPYQLICFGSATYDVFITTQTELIEIKSPTTEESFIAYPSGSKIIIKDLEFYTGGGGTNTACTFSALGLSVGYVGIIGTDPTADLIKQELHQLGIAFLGKQKEGKTGFSVILDSFAHDRTILAYKGVNDNFEPGDFSVPQYPALWYYFSSLTGQAFTTFLEIVTTASKQGIKCAFNPSSYLIKEKRAEILGILPNITALIFNFEEAKLLLGYRTEEKLDPFMLLKQLLSYGPTYVVITDGANGLYAGTREHEFFVRIQPRKVRVVESTGAGDAFASAFIGGLVLKKDFEYALLMGLTNAEGVIGMRGAKKGIRNLAQIQEIIKTQPVSVTKIKSP